MSETILRHIETLYHIACTSDEADTVRAAFAALIATPAGREYLEMNPIST